MADIEGITQVQSFTERTLKYGRNLMVGAVPIIAFAWVPVVDLAKSRPLNFEIKPGGEIWIWSILLTILVYYAVRFFGLAIPDFGDWRRKFGDTRKIQNLKVAETRLRLKNAKRAVVRECEKGDTSIPEEQRGREVQLQALRDNVEKNQREFDEARSNRHIYRWRRNYFWITDAGMPTLFFGCALVASSSQIHRLMNTSVCGG